MRASSQRLATFLGLASFLAIGSFVTPRPRDLPDAGGNYQALLEAISPTSGALARVGGAPPPFTLPTATGGPTSGQFRMGPLIGHNPVVILFWATWCVPCQQELPFYETLYQRHREAGLRVVGISMDNATTITRVGPTARRLGITFDIVTDLDTRITTQLNPRRAAPLSIWVNREGRITWEREGYSPAEQQTVTAGIEALVTGH